MLILIILEDLSIPGNTAFTGKGACGIINKRNQSTKNEAQCLLTFEEKLAIIESFPQLQRKNVSLGRVNFHYEESVFDKKIVVHHLHPNGNGFVYAGRLPEYDSDNKGMVNIRDYSADALRSLIQSSIYSLSDHAEADAECSTAEGERWIGPEKHILLLVHENDLWNVYTGLNLEASFESHEEAEQYMQEEGFTRM
ncbi:hypothetical protein D1872_169610 [compost metagenome]